LELDKVEMMLIVTAGIRPIKMNNKVNFTFKLKLLIARDSIGEKLYLKIST